MERRLVAMESKVGAAHDQTRAATDPLTAEIGELGTLVKRLAETVAAQEMRLADVARRPAAPASAFGAIDAFAPVPVAVARRARCVESAGLGRSRAGDQSPAAWSGTRCWPTSAPPSRPIAIDLYLQPIVTLPQRKVRYYEAMSRLRTEQGDVLQAADFIPTAESGGLMPRIDQLVVFRCVQVVRRILLKNRDLGLFCNVSGSTLADSTLFPQLLEFLDANRAIASSLVLEFTQSAVRAMGPIEHESLTALAERGFRFSLDNVTDLRIDPRELADRGFRFIKIPASLLLNRSGAAAADTPADLLDLLGRFGIDLIADKIEGEAKRGRSARS